MKEEPLPPKLTEREELLLEVGTNTNDYRDISQHLKVLNLGCGTSLLAEELFETDGFLDILNIDLSPFCIRQMRQRAVKQKLPETIVFKQMDCRLIKLPSDSVNLVIDKATLDSLLCGNRAFKKTAQMLDEVQRVLKIGGMYLAISFAPPESRLLHLQRAHLGWHIETIEIQRNDSGH